MGREEQAACDDTPRLEQLPELEATCPRCGGEGELDYGDGPFRCGVCDGAGYKPTPFGEKVLALMRHNCRPMYEDMEDGPLR